MKNVWYDVSIIKEKALFNFNEHFEKVGFGCEYKDFVINLLILE